MHTKESVIMSVITSKKEPRNANGFAFAGPTKWTSFLPWINKNTTLRKVARKQPPPLHITKHCVFVKPHILVGSIIDIENIYQLWKNHYKNNRTFTNIPKEKIANFFETDQSKNICLGIYDKDSVLIATLMSRPIRTSINESVRIMDGCVIHSDWRNRGIMKWLFAWHDHMYPNTVTIWSSNATIPKSICVPHSNDKTLQLNLNQISVHKDDLYDVEILPWAAMKSIYSTTPMEGITYIPSSESSTITYYKVATRVNNNYSLVFGVSDTYTHTTLQQHIFKIVYCCIAKNGNTLTYAFAPAETESAIVETALISICKKMKLDVIIFQDVGNCTEGWDTGMWKQGPDHNVYIYNYISTKRDAILPYSFFN